MAEGPEKESKTEEPTEQKIRHAQEDGSEPVSHEVQILFSLSAIAALLTTSGTLASKLSAILGAALSTVDQWPLATPADFNSILWFSCAEATGLLVPAVLTMSVAGIAAAAVQTQMSFRPKRLAPNFSRLSPIEGFKRLFSMQSVLALAKTMVKLAAVSATAALLLRQSIGTLLQATMMDAHLIPDQLQAYLTRLLMPIIAISAVIAAGDTAWTRIKWKKSLRMTRQDVKDERKQSDGDPAIKAKISAISRARSRKRMMAAVPNATLVVVNPTHYAVAMRYRRSEGGAPVVVARGIDDIALDIKRTAAKHNVEIVEDPPLARALYESTKLDQAIPAEFYSAVARILTVIYRNRPHAKR